VLPLERHDFAELAEAERVDDATVKAVVETVLCTLVDR